LPGPRPGRHQRVEFGGGRTADMFGGGAQDVTRDAVAADADDMAVLRHRVLAVPAGPLPVPDLAVADTGRGIRAADGARAGARRVFGAVDGELDGGAVAPGDVRGGETVVADHADGLLGEGVAGDVGDVDVLGGDAAG